MSKIKDVFVCYFRIQSCYAQIVMVSSKGKNVHT